MARGRIRITDVEALGIWIESGRWPQPERGQSAEDWRHTFA